MLPSEISDYIRKYKGHYKRPGPSHSLSNFPYDVALGLVASSNAYAYDKIMYNQNDIIRNVFKYRSRNEIRTDILVHKNTFVLNEATGKVPSKYDTNFMGDTFYRKTPKIPENNTFMKYNTYYSSDFMGVWIMDINFNETLSDEQAEKEGLIKYYKKVIFGFRGTDPSDPIRFLNLIPISWEQSLYEKFIEYQLQDSDVGFFGKASKLKELYEEFPYKDFMETIFFKLPMSISDKEYYDECTCNNTNFNSCQVGGITHGKPLKFSKYSRENLQFKVLEKTSSYTGCANKVPFTTKKVSDYMDTNLVDPSSAYVKKGFKATPYNYQVILGGEKSPASDFSDARANCAITLAAVANKGTDATKIIHEDPKHQTAARKFNSTMIDIVSEITNPKISAVDVVVSGHSLGGSLGCYALLKFLEEGDSYFVNKKGLINYQYIGFNAAILNNHRDFAEGKVNKSNRYKNTNDCFLQIRNVNDAVSGIASSVLPTIPQFMTTIDYKKEEEALYSAQRLSSSDVHGLWQFKYCDLQIVGLYDKENNYKSTVE